MFINQHLVPLFLKIPGLKVQSRRSQVHGADAQVLRGVGDVGDGFALELRRAAADVSLRPAEGNGDDVPALPVMRKISRLAKPDAAYPVKVKPQDELLAYEPGIFILPFILRMHLSPSQEVNAFYSFIIV